MNYNKKTCAYIRLSEEDLKKDKDKNSASVLNQIEYIKSYAKDNNFIVDEEYIDDGYSGINYARPAFEKMKKKIEDGKISLIITKDFSRLGREFIETSYYISKYFPENNVRYIAINDNYDSENSELAFNDINVGIKSIINDKYIKDSSVKIREIKRLKTQKGYFLGFIAPYGYKKVIRDDKITLDIDYNVSKVVERIFKDITNGFSRRKIADELNKEGVLSPIIYLNMTMSKGKKYYSEWTDKIIYRIIRNRTYVGDTIVRKSTKFNYKKLKRDYVAIRDRDFITNTHPAIISNELYESANKKIRTSNRKKNLLKNYDGVLKNLVICGECGKQMSINGRIRESGNLHFSIRCNNSLNNKEQCNNNRRISDNILRKVIYNELINVINSYVDKNMIINNATEELEKKEKLNIKIRNLESDIEFHNMNIRNLYLQKTNNSITLDIFIDKKQLEDALKSEKEILLKELLKEKDIALKKSQVIKKYSEFLCEDNIYKYAFRELISKIIINKDRTITIEFNFNISEDKVITI